ncbi:MAG: ABC transporter ATP-binding protein [Leptospirales bacterium]
MIEVEQLSYKYPHGTNDTLKNIEFKVGTGQVFGFLGPSGAGKSTTQAILTRQTRDAYRGNLTILGKNIKDWGRDIFEKIGVSFELPNHYLKLTAKENLDLFASLYQKPVHKTNDLLGMVGLESEKDRRVGEFSKGMKMRLNFVRALLHDPDLIFLDEPTSGLDPSNARIIKDIIIDLKNRGKTIFLTTHNMTDADELCDQVAFLVEGKIRLIDSPKELKLRYGKKSVKVEYLNSGKQKEKSFEMNKLGENTNFISLLNKHEIQTIHTEEASLDQIFIETTGQKLK